MLTRLLRLGAYHRSDAANWKLPPTGSALAGHGHLNLATSHGPLDVLCELGMGEGYDELLPRSELVLEGELAARVLSLEALVAVKAKTGRMKDRLMLPRLIATLEERARRKE